MLAGCGGSDSGSGGSIEAAPGALANASEGTVSLSLSERGYLRAARVRIPVEGDVESAATAFLEEHAGLFGLDAPAYGTAVVGSTMLPDGSTAVDIQVSVGDTPVDGGLITIVLRDGAIRYASSSVAFPEPELDTTTSVSVSDAQAAVSGEVDPASGVLVYVDVGGDVGSDSTGLEPAWRFSVLGTAPETVLVSARTGQLIARRAEQLFGLDRTVYDAQGGQDAEAAKMPNLVVADEARGVLPGAPPDAAPAFEAVKVANDFFEDTLRRDSYDAQCSPLNVVINLGAGGPFWDRNDTIALNGGWAEEDLTLHEFGHAVIDNSTIDYLKYEMESGAIHEAIADAFAALASPDGPGRWTLGETLPEEIRSDPDLQAQRDMSNPAAFGHPDHYDGFVTVATTGCESQADCDAESVCRQGACVCTANTAECDNGKVHTNGGILNHAFYLMSEGGTHATRGGESITGIGDDKTARILMFATQLMRANTTFLQLRAHMAFACQSLAEQNTAGIRHEDCGSVLNAFAAVGLGSRDGDRDSWADNVDNCPTTPNPDQDPDALCIADPLLHCKAARYDRAFELYLEGVDIGSPRKRSDALQITGRCALAARDFLTAELLGFLGAEEGGTGGLAANLYLAEFAALRLGKYADAAVYREGSFSAARESGMCSGGSEAELNGCADLQRTWAFEDYENVVEGTE